MKKFARRDKMKIYSDLLTILESQLDDAEGIVLTRLQMRLNVPYDRLKTYLAQLKDLGLIEDASLPKLTEKGKQYIREYENVLDFMNRMGIAYR
jgi:predicted transcriptional regulator